MACDADIKAATDRFNDWVKRSAISEDDYAWVIRLLSDHGNERGKVFDELLGALRRDTDIQSRWDSACDRALALHEKLNDTISNKISYGLSGIALKDFYEGEKIVWQVCKGGRIGLIVETFHDIGDNNVEIFKQLEEDLKKAREDASIVDEVVHTTFGDMQKSVRSLVAGVGELLLDKLSLETLGKIGSMLKSKASETEQSFVKGSNSIREMARKKKVAQDILTRNSDMLDQAKAQIGDAAIKDMLSRAEDIASSWMGSASRGEYRAADWGDFGRACCENLKDKAAPVTEKAKILFDNMQPLYLEAIKTSFVSLLSDPARLQRAKGELDDDTQKMFDDLAKENLAVSLLHDSDPKKEACEVMQQITTEVGEALKQLKDAISVIEAQMKR